jgi:hypothetical protein
MRRSLVNFRHFRELISYRDSACKVLTMPTPQSGWREPNETRLLNVEKDLKDLVSSIAALKTTPITKSDGWFKRNAHIWPFAAVIIALGAFLFGPAVVGRATSIFFNSFFDDRLKSDTSVLVINSHIDEKLAQPTRDIQEIRTGVEKITLRLDLQDKAALKPQAFKQALPGLADTLKQSVKIDLKASPETNAALQRNLESTDRSAPGFWNAASQFINYRSATVPSVMPDCTEQPLKLDVHFTQGSPIITHGPYVLTGCALELDSPQAASYFAQALSLADLRIVRGLITYRGGPIVIPIGRGKLILERCTYNFVIPQQAVPAPKGQMLIATLLAMPDLESVTVDRSTRN